VLACACVRHLLWLRGWKIAGARTRRHHRALVVERIVQVVHTVLALRGVRFGAIALRRALGRRVVAHPRLIDRVRRRAGVPRRQQLQLIIGSSPRGDQGLLGLVEVQHSVDRDIRHNVDDCAVGIGAVGIHALAAQLRRAAQAAAAVANTDGRPGVLGGFFGRAVGGPPPRSLAPSASHWL
jgi:hypothetical protein